jgi:plastocyanin
MIGHGLCGYDGAPAVKFTLALAAFGLVAANAAAQPVDWSHATNVDVELSSFKFSPEVLHLKHGEAYALHFHNSAGGGHDFVAKDFFAHASLAPASQQAVAHGEIELHGGATADVTLIAPSAGTYEVHCSHFMHESMGMKGQIIVE